MGCNCPCAFIESASWVTTPGRRARKRFGGTMTSDKRTWHVCLRAQTVSFIDEPRVFQDDRNPALSLGPVPTDGGLEGGRRERRRGRRSGSAVVTAAAPTSRCAAAPSKARGRDNGRWRP